MYAQVKALSRDGSREETGYGEKISIIFGKKEKKKKGGINLISTNKHYKLHSPPPHPVHEGKKMSAGGTKKRKTRAQV